MSRELRPYQIEAIEAIVTGLADGGSGQLHAACGSGKTLMAMRAAERLTGPDGIVVVLAPSLGLVAQILGNWKADSAIACQRFAVCSDETVAGKGDDTATIRTAELGVPVSTDRDRIAKWLTVEGPRLVVGTYLSANRLAAAARHAGREIDMLICDEAHHLAGNADAHTRRIMSPDALPARRRLYVTATPRNGRAQDDEQHDTRTLSMNDEATFGPVLYSYPFSRGIAEGYLADYRIAVIGVTDQEVRALLSRDDIEYVDGIGLRTAAAQVALARAYRDFGMRRAITFHGSVADAQRFVETLPATLASLPAEASAPAPVCLHANGAMDSEQRHGVLDRLKNVPENGWAVCSNVRCLSEGVDVPALDGVLFGNPKKSTVDIVQAASRALRLHPDVPGLSTIIVPVIVPDENEADAIDPGAYEALFQILRALKDHDDVLSAELNAARAEIGGPICIDPSGPDEDNTDADVVFPADGGGPEDAGPDGDPGTLGNPVPVTPGPGLSKIEFHDIAPRALAELRLVILRQITSAWWDTYAKAVAFYAEHGHLEPEGSHPIAQWVRSQRNRQTRMSQEKVEALDRIGMVWGVPRDAKWQQMRSAAMEFRARHGHLRVPKHYTTPNGLELGAWIRSTRAMHARGQLPPDRCAELERLGVSWNVFDDAWGAAYGAAQDYYKRHGHLDIPQDYEIDGIRLGRWIRKRRWQRTAGNLPEGRIALLDAIGMIWDPNQSRWEQGFESARAFRNKHGHLQVPDRCVFDGFPLGMWIMQRRAEFKAGTIDNSRRDALERIGMIWDFNGWLWQRSYADAQSFHRAHGHLMIPHDYLAADGGKLGRWLVKQRVAHRAGRLPSDRVAALDALGIVWDVYRSKNARQRDALAGPVQS